MHRIGNRIGCCSYSCYQFVQKSINNNISLSQTTSDLNKWHVIIETTYTAAVGSNEIRCGFDDFMTRFHAIVTGKKKKKESEAWFPLDEYCFSSFISLNSSISTTQNGLSVIRPERFYTISLELRLTRSAHSWCRIPLWYNDQKQFLKLDFIISSLLTYDIAFLFCYFIILFI